MGVVHRMENEDSIFGREFDDMAMRLIGKMAGLEAACQPVLSQCAPTTDSRALDYVADVTARVEVKLQNT